MADLAIVVREGAYDRILTPLAFAYLAASSGQEVEILFVNWAVRTLSKNHADELPISAERAGNEEWLKNQIESAGFPAKISDLIHALERTGKVKLYACTLAAQIFGVSEDDLIDGAEFLPANEFLAKMAEAKVTMTF
ncbi:MAG: DsrE/DsrF/DrsH-like family protein [Armatimonadetes bacterium]|nr:DsrE/DsrF/DrsH-like family protein [Armatimonadota bacterium]MCX7968009.1 DsrE/DsrF/DrsH-like family protein [Armatimonadota bacterium]MDW8142056.1 DsrE/DsrF/DrsH-like family protein [Armatimonadota bacterium]